MIARVLLVRAVMGLTAILHSAGAFAEEFDQPFGLESQNDIANIATDRAQILKEEEWLRWRKKHIVPEIMRRVGVDMWLVGRSGRGGARALYYSLVPANCEGLVEPQYEVLIFYDRGVVEGVEEFAVDMDEVAGIVQRRNPQKIGVGRSAREDFSAAIGEDFASLLVMTGDLQKGFLEKRSPDEISAFHHVARVAYDIIGEAFSNKVIIPDVTTTDDVNWWIRQRYRQLGLETSDHPTITVQRSELERPKYSEGDEHFNIVVAPRNGYNTVIRRGDIIGCDTGINYFGIGTDTQQSAYVLKESEEDVPYGLKVAMNNGNIFQNHLAKSLQPGRPSNDAINEAVRAAWADGVRPSIYGHPLPYYLTRYNSPGGLIKVRYGAGPSLGGDQFSEPAPIQPAGGYPVYPNTTYALEMHTWTSVSEWGGQDVRIKMEQNVAMTEGGLIFLGGRQTKWHVIR